MLKKFLLIQLILTLIVLHGQEYLIDDFQFKSDQWFWRADGNQSIPTVESGLLHLNLQNAESSQYCNTEIYNPIESYDPGTRLKLRLKATPAQIGSRGWGFWDGNLSDVLLDYDVAWIMQQKSNLNDPIYNWFLFGVDGNSVTNKQVIDLEPLLDETLWHTYEIIWKLDEVKLLIDNQFIFSTNEHLPDEGMRFDIWIDNRVININDPLYFWNNESEGSEMFVDYVQISGINGPQIERNTKGNIILWDSPNTFPIGDNNYLWKNYDFSTVSDGIGLVYITGNAETYNGISEADELKIILDENDFGWNSDHAFDGDLLNGVGKSIVIPWNFSDGNHKLEIFTKSTPFLKDVLILHSENGTIIFNNNFNETPSNTDSLWHSISFSLIQQSELDLLISGSGYQGDKIRIQIDENDYGYGEEYGINGTNLLGQPKTVVINEVLQAGNHNLFIYRQGSPMLYSAAGYGTKLNNFSIKILLEGAYSNNDLMNSFGEDINSFPFTQPFNQSPWNYNGHETIHNSLENVVDWVLVEICNEMFTPNKRYFRAGLLHIDGNIEDSEGGFLKMHGIEAGTYYLKIHHRNHLSVMSGNYIEIN